LDIIILLYTNLNKPEVAAAAVAHPSDQ
jgi:hypothetical protein